MDKVEYSVAIERSGIADLGELCRCVNADAVAGVVRALLNADDRRISAIHVAIVRLPG